MIGTGFAFDQITALPFAQIGKDLSDLQSSPFVKRFSAELRRKYYMVSAVPFCMRKRMKIINSFGFLSHNLFASCM